MKGIREKVYPVPAGKSFQNNDETFTLVGPMDEPTFIKLGNRWPKANRRPRNRKDSPFTFSGSKNYIWVIVDEFGYYVAKVGAVVLDDVIGDAGSFTVGGMPNHSEMYGVDYRGRGFNTLLDKARMPFIKNLSESKKIPIVLDLSNDSEGRLSKYKSLGFETLNAKDEKHPYIPERHYNTLRSKGRTYAIYVPESMKEDKAMKKAWLILKADTRPDIRNEAQYEAASLEDRKKFHRKQSVGYDGRWKALQSQYSVDLTDVENPIYQEMKYYQDIKNFHNRQLLRLKSCIRLGKTECNDYYSQELEGENRRKLKNQTTPTGKLDPYVELSLDVYNNLTDEQKIKYHASMKKGKNSAFHRRMYHRLTDVKLNLPTFPSPEHGGESIKGIEYSKQEYDNMNNEQKRKYHVMMSRRAKKLNDTELAKWYIKMYDRLKENRSLPTYFSPEHEQEEQ